MRAIVEQTYAISVSMTCRLVACNKWTGFFAVEVRKSTWELVVAIFRGYLTGAVRDVSSVWYGSVIIFRVRNKM